MLEYKLTKKLLDLLFPHYCLQCKKLDWLICQECLNKEKIQKPNLCPYCLENSEMGKTCRECMEENEWRLNGLFYLQFYREKSVLIKALFELKYELRRDFAQPIGNKMAKFWQVFLVEWLREKRIEAVSLMPMHEQKLKKRGFNQMELIWKTMLKSLPQLESWQKNTLIKNKHTKAQMSLRADERKTNAEGSLGVNESCVLPDKIMILDDIGTSLSTLDEASKVLKMSGVREVYALVLARQILE
jgi:competence protein ComFC